jgi:cytochrome b6-f complex iron-sulfur subunit/menaquinol-cytochrome c reductase iron-sulfur subunit
VTHESNDAGRHKRTDPSEARSDRPPRRAVLGTIVAGGVVGCGALLVPVARFLGAPSRADGAAGVWIRAASLDMLAEGVPKRVVLVSDRRDAWVLEKQVELGSAWLIRHRSTVQAFSTVCPHLGCAIDRSASGSGFNCPCHDSAFAPDGRRLTGPSPRGLDALATRIDDSSVHVRFQRFRQGTSEKVPVG